MHCQTWWCWSKGLVYFVQKRAPSTIRCTQKPAPCTQYYTLYSETSIHFIAILWFLIDTESIIITAKSWHLKYTWMIDLNLKIYAHFVIPPWRPNYAYCIRQKRPYFIQNQSLWLIKFVNDLIKIDRVYTAKSENVWNWCNLSKIVQVVISTWLGTTWGLNQSFVCVSKLWRERVSVS